MDSQQRRLVAGRYRLLSRLGAGGMGTVWRAEDEVLGREVAVKEVTFPHGLSDEDREVLRERTRREARAAARLDHPSAVTVYDVVEEDGSPFLVMELVEASTLSQIVRRDGPLTPQRTAQVGLALLGALEAAHRQGIVHRDVKPGNVLLCPGDDGRVVLTDFGIASSVGDSSITSTGLLLGSPSYIAPERAKGQSPGPASDLWSLGATLFTAVEGRPPFDGGEPLLTVTAVVTGEHEPFLASGPLEPVLEGLLERDPEQRLTASAARALLGPLASRAADAPAAAPAVVAAPSPASAAAERRTEHTTAMPMREVREAAEPDPAHASDLTTATRAPGGVAFSELAWDRDDDRSDRSDDVDAGQHAGPGPLTRRPPRVRPAPRRRSMLPVALLVVVLVLGAAIVGFALSGGIPGRTDGTASSPGASADPSPEPSVGEPSAAALPAGWTRYESDDGWSVGVPPGFEQSLRGAQVQFRNDETRRTLRIRTEPARGEPRAMAESLSNGLDGQLPQYRPIRVGPASGSDLPAADLEFTYFEETELRVVDRTVVPAGGDVASHLYWQVNAGDWDDARPLFDQIAATFQPA